LPYGCRDLPTNIDWEEALERALLPVVGDVASTASRELCVHLLLIWDDGHTPPLSFVHFCYTEVYSVGSGRVDARRRLRGKLV